MIGRRVLVATLVVACIAAAACGSDDDAEPRDDDAEPRDDDAEPRDDDAEPRDDDAEPRDDEAEPRPDEAEARDDEAEALPDEAESRDDETEALPDEAEARVDEAEALPDEAEALPDLRDFWRVQIGSSGAETSYGVAATPDGEVVITASTEGNLAGDNQGQRDVFLARYSNEGDQLWALQTGGESNDSPLGVSVAPDGSIYVGGFTDGDFAGPNQGSADVWLARFDGDGNELWRRQFGSDQWDRGFDVSAFDGGAYISGYSAGTLDPATDLGGFDGFAARFDADGNQQWIRQFGTDATDWGQGSALAPDGGLFVTGYTEGDFGGPNSGDKDLFVVRLSADGEQEWVTQLGSDALDWTQGVGLGPEGSVLVAGSTEGLFATNFGGERDMIVVSLNAEGEEQWRWQSGLPNTDTAFEVRYVNNRILVTGTVDRSSGEAEASEERSVAIVVAAGRDLALAWLGSDGVPITITSFRTDAVEEATGLAVATDGSIYWSGYTTGSAFGDSAGGSDLLLGGLAGGG